MIMVSPTPDKESEASNVTFFLLLRGIVPFARFPLGARAYKRVRAMFEPHSSRKTKMLLSRFFTSSLHRIRSSSFLSFASSVFFSCPLESCNCTSHSHDTYAVTASLLPQITMLLQCGIWIRF